MRSWQAAIARNRALFGALGLAVVIAGLLLTVQRLPVGMQYVDLIFLEDANYRMDLGYVPSTDFVSPIGPLSLFWYWLASHLPMHPHRLLGGQILSGIALLPALAAACWNRRARSVLLICVPFLLFAFLPFNYDPSGTGGVGYAGLYNREGAVGFYVLMALTCGARWRWRAVAIAYVLLVLVFTKVTFFLAGLALFAVWALPARHRWFEFAIVVALMLASLAIVELTLHLVSGYARDTLTFIAAGSGGLYGRTKGYFFGHSEISIAVGLLGLAVVTMLARRAAQEVRRGLCVRSVVRFVRLNHAMIFAACLLAGSLPLEAQNTGSWDFIYLWPVLLSVIRAPMRGGPQQIAQIGRIATFAPLFIQPLFRCLWLALALRSGVPTTDYFSADLQSYIPTSRKSGDLLTKGLATFDVWLAPPPISDYPMPAEEAPWHVAYLISLKGTDAALKRLLAERPADQRRLLVLDYVNPFNRVLGVEPFLDLPYFITPFRNMSVTTRERLRADAQATDILVVPHCPQTIQRRMIRALIPDATFIERRSVPLNECWSAYVKP